MCGAHNKQTIIMGFRRVQYVIEIWQFEMDDVLIPHTNRCQNHMLKQIGIPAPAVPGFIINKVQILFCTNKDIESCICKFNDTSSCIQAHNFTDKGL